MPIGAVLGISAAATAGTNIYSTKKAAGENRRAIQAQERMEREAIAAQERAEAAEREQRDREMQAQIALNQAQWDAYSRAMAPYWQTGHEAFGKLSGLLGLARPAPFEIPSSGGGGIPGTPPTLEGASWVDIETPPRRVPGTPPTLEGASWVDLEPPPRGVPEGAYTAGGGGPRFGRGREYAANVMQMPAQRTSNPLGDLRSLTDLYTLADRAGIGQQAPAGVGRPIWV